MPHRHFLGWDRAFLPRVADWLLAGRDAEGGPDLSATLVVLPGRRAARRLEQLLAERGGPALVPPRLVTEGGLADALALAPLALLSPLESRLAWCAALRELEPDARERLLGPSAAAGELPAQLAAAQELARAFAQLAAEGLDFAAVAGRARLGERARERWRALAALQQRFDALTARLGRQDASRAGLALLEHGRFERFERVVLAGLPDLDRNQRALLERQPAPVTSLVFAPEGLADSFDAWGALRPEAWAERAIELAAASWTVADGPQDLARDLVAWLARLQREERDAGRALATSEVTIGLLDPSLEPYLARALRDRELTARSASGEPLERTPPLRLLSALLEHLRARTFASFAALCRHPDVERFVERAAGLAPGWLARLLDAYAVEHLPRDLEGEVLGASAAPCASEDEEDERAGRRARDGRALAESLERARARLRELLGPLASSAREPLGAWIAPLRELLARLWRDEPADSALRWTLEQTFDALGAALAECDALAEEPEAVRALGADALSAVEFLELVLARLARERIPQAPEPNAIELLGFLELALDEARCLYLAGLNEGALPQGGARDTFLPESLRRELGLAHESRRVARDVYALSAILASRPHVRAASARTSADGDPLRPSRLLFHRPDAETPSRVRAFYERPPSRAASLAPLASIASGTADPAEREFHLPWGALDPPESVTVTSLRLYLESPYQFYLRCVLGLETLDDRAEDLDARAFGILAHEVLHAFGASELRDERDEAAIAAFLERELAERAARRFGDEPRAAVELQVRQLAWRLREFARAQAALAREGWRIRAVEHTPPPLVRSADGRSLRIEGRVDRIDYHEERGVWRVLDYKTGDEPESPKKAKKRSGEWVDLQLPLYREMLRATTGTAAVELGNFALPKLAGACGVLLAPWSESDLADALATADWAVARILQGHWDELGAEPRDPAFAAIEGRGLLGGRGDEEPEPEEPENGEAEA